MGTFSCKPYCMTRARLERRFDAKIPRWSAQGVSGFIYKGGEKLLNFAVADERRSLSGSGGLVKNEIIYPPSGWDGDSKTRVSPTTRS